MKNRFFFLIVATFILMEQVSICVVPCLTIPEFTKTYAQISVIARALEFYAKDHDGLYPVPEGSDLYAPFEGDPAHGPNPLTWTIRKDVNASTLIPYLERYLPKWKSPRVWIDAWGNSIYYAVSSDQKHFLVYSYGKDGKRSLSFSYTWPDKGTCNLEEDMIRNELMFISFPNGVSRG